MARLLTREALEALYRNPIVIPDLPEHETANTLIDVSRRGARPAPATAPVPSEDLFEQWLEAYPQPSHDPIAVPPSLWSRLRAWLGGRSVALTPDRALGG